jgi:hypothetical protein
MKKSVVLAKSRGVLLFAFNTERTDYVRIAEQAARLVHHTLDLPVTLVTETTVESEHFDTVISVDNELKNYKVGETGSWRNGDRFRAYELSPYDETLLVDTDYLMLDCNLLKLFDQDFDYRIMSWNNKPSTRWNLKMGMFGHDYQWATAILFRKTVKSKMLFDLVGRVQRNYLYYMKLYHMREGNFRNDYAFTIANNILNGYDLSFDQGIVTPMLTFADVTTSITTQGDMLVVKERERAYVIPRQNIHVMDKGYLLSDNFADFVDSICAK